jgi:hypothetical protein
MSKERDPKFAEIVIARDGECQDCGATGNLHAHHIIPISLGGADDPSNGIALCPSCHADRHPDVPRGLFLNGASGGAKGGDWNATSLAADLGCCIRTITRIAKRLNIGKTGCRWAFSISDALKIKAQLRPPYPSESKSSSHQRFVPQTYNIKPIHIAIVRQVAKDHGASGESSALRFIIDKYVEYEQRYGGNGHQLTPDQVPCSP